MIRRRTIALAASLLGIAAAACDDGGLTRPRFSSLGGFTSQVQSTPLHLEIVGLIQTLFPKGLETAAGTRWESVAEKVAANQPTVARSMLLELSRWVQSKMPQMETSADRTREMNEADAKRLLLLMWLYVYDSPNADPPDIGDGTKLSVAIITPEQSNTVITVQSDEGDGTFQEAGIIVPKVNETSVVSIYKTTLQSLPGVSPSRADDEPPLCAGPLKTKLCQYPHFYVIEKIPRTALTVPARVMICHRHEQLLADHDRFAVAHDLPADPARYTYPDRPDLIRDQNGERIEILKRSTDAPILNTFMTCPPEHSGEERLAFSASMSRSMIDQGWEHDVRDISGFLGLGGAAKLPINASIAGAGRSMVVVDPNDFAEVDPFGRPDLQPSLISASKSEVIAGEQVSITYQVLNPSTLGEGGTAAAASENNVPSSIRLVALSEGAQVGATSPEVPGQTAVFVPRLAPDQAGGPFTVTVTIPADQPAGTYLIGPYVALNSSVNGGLAEVNATNNGTGIQIVVRRPAVDPVARTVLLYGPTFGMERFRSHALSLGYTVNVFSAQQWMDATEADFASYDVIVVPSMGFGTPTAALSSTKAVWGAAIMNGNMALAGLDADAPAHFDDEEDEGTHKFLENLLAWAAAGRTTGFVSMIECENAYGWVPTSGPFAGLTATGGCALNDEVHVTDPSHPVMLGLDDEQLSNWTASVHTYFPTVGGFTPIAKIGGSGSLAGQAVILVKAGIP